MRTFLLILAFSLVSIKTHAQISLTEFEILKSVFMSEFEQDLKKSNAYLTINRPPSPASPNFWWDLDTVHASYSQYKDRKTGVMEHNIFLFGGYARMQGMTVDGVAMTLCHELGHGIGGKPYKDKGNDEVISAEGQSDYFAARHCIKRVFKKLPEAEPVMAPTPFTEKLCQDRFKTGEELYLCYRGFQTLEVERIFLRTQGPKDTHYETPDRTVVKKVDLRPDFYPSPQCRLDTMVAGILEKERPRCWWAP